MPDRAEKRRNKWRVVEATTGRIARTKRGNPVDGGGHKTREAAQHQVNARNAGRHGWHGTRRK